MLKIYNTNLGTNKLEEVEEIKNDIKKFSKGE